MQQKDGRHVSMAPAISEALVCSRRISVLISHSALHHSFFHPIVRCLLETQHGAGGAEADQQWRSLGAVRRAS